MYEDIYEQKVDLEKQLEDDALKLEERRSISERLRSIYKALGEKDLTQGEDPLADKWDREWEQGITPDFDETL
jgi:hypothetical protein